MTEHFWCRPQHRIVPSNGQRKEQVNISENSHVQSKVCVKQLSYWETQPNAHIAQSVLLSNGKLTSLRPRLWPRFTTFIKEYYKCGSTCCLEGQAAD